MARKLSRRNTLVKLEEDVGKTVPVCVRGKEADGITYVLNAGLNHDDSRWTFISYCHSTIVLDRHYGTNLSMSNISINHKGVYELYRGDGGPLSDYRYLMYLTGNQTKLWKRRNRHFKGCSEV